MLYMKLYTVYKLSFIISQRGKDQMIVDLHKLDNALKNTDAIS